MTSYVLYNSTKRFTVAVNYRHRKLYYIAITPSTVMVNRSSYFGHIMGFYDVYCTFLYQKMIPLYHYGAVVQMYDDDAPREN